MLQGTHHDSRLVVSADDLIIKSKTSLTDVAGRWYRPDSLLKLDPRRALHFHPRPTRYALTSCGVQLPFAFSVLKTQANEETEA